MAWMLSAACAFFASNSESFEAALVDWLSFSQYSASLTGDIFASARAKTRFLPSLSFLVPWTAIAVALHNLGTTITSEGAVCKKKNEVDLPCISVR